ncbi:valine--tRNA ligase [Cyclobacteriaceae bacterium]|nr:valine--tRNA ligase [Cyclobacteriaceae bacterium]
MALSTKYDPAQVEDKWYQYWMEKGHFKAKVNPNKKPFSIVIPPPNVTGVLHMGHMLNNTIQDILIRKARMQGFEACWVPGTDHASIATEAKVVKMLRTKGIKKSDLSREAFMEHAWEWKEKYGGIILEQLKKLGASCDWDRTAFTMDKDYYASVIKVFVDLFNKGYVYRSLRMVNWDVEAQTAVSNEEVLYKEGGEISKLYSVKYQIENSSEYITIATQRPETIMGDTGIAVNPEDRRYQHLIGKTVIIPFVNRRVPIIADEYVTMDFGTGCLKVTPAHDTNDYEIGLRHGLEIIDTIGLDGKLTSACEVEKYTGMDRFEVRKQIVKDMKVMEILVNEEDFNTRIGRSERTDTVIEPKLSLQWFIKMKSISKTAHEVVMNDEIRLFPPKFKNTYHHWMENVRDWCISRQLWWGQRIPAYYFGKGEDDFVVAVNEKEALTLAQKKSGKMNLKPSDLHQDEDVLDTWASSWLFPLAVFDGFNDQGFDTETGKILPKKNEELDYFYPTDTLVTAPEILFFWVARMVIAGYEYTGEKPFKNVYLTGIVRDKQRRKMSKSLGNSPNPLDLIKKYGADGVRTGMLFSSPAGNDLLFDEKLVEQGQKFSNKIWNAFRLIQGWEIEEIEQPSENQLAIRWFESNFQKALLELEDHFPKFRMSDALMTVYKLVWNDFCSWYLEWIKPNYGAPIDTKTHQQTVSFLEQLMKVLHPFMPFITEEIWHSLQKRAADEDLIVAEWPISQKFDETILADASFLFEIIAQIRNIRNKNQISPKIKLTLNINSEASLFTTIHASLMKMANLEKISFIKEKPAQSHAFLIHSKEFSIVSTKTIDLDSERETLQKELDYTRGFLENVLKKMSNERFVNHAPPKVLEIEKKKQADAEAKIETLMESLKKL